MVVRAAGIIEPPWYMVVRAAGKIEPHRYMVVRPIAMADLRGTLKIALNTPSNLLGALGLVSGVYSS